MPGTPTARGYTTLDSADAADIEQVNVPIGQIDADISALEDEALPAGTSPYFSAYRSAAVSLADGATVIFDSVVQDPNGWYNTTTGLFTPDVEGMYRLSWGVALASAITADQYFTAQASKAGVTAGLGSLAVERGTVTLRSVGSCLVSFVGGASAKIVVAHNVGSAVALGTGLASTHFEAEYVGVLAGP